MNKMCIPQNMRTTILLLSLLTIFPAAAADTKVGDITISNPTVRATPGGAKVGAGYLVMRNTGTVADRLVRIESPVAERVEVHSTVHEGGVARMREREGGVPVAPGGESPLAPGGDHLMFSGLKAPFKVGETITATLVFERAGSVMVTFPVEPLGGNPNKGHGAH